MEGFGIHTFRLVNAKNESTFVKFHRKPKLKLQSVMWNEAVKINGADPDFHRRDLWTAIKSGNFPEWELQLQLFDQAFADSFDFEFSMPARSYLRKSCSRSRWVGWYSIACLTTCLPKPNRSLL